MYELRRTGCLRFNDLLDCTIGVVHCFTLPHLVVEMKMVCGIWRSVVRTDWELLGAGVVELTIG